MTESFSEKKDGLVSETTSKSSSSKKNWQSPELTEVDYSKTNATFTGIGSDTFGYS